MYDYDNSLTHKDCIDKNFCVNRFIKLFLFIFVLIPIFTFVSCSDDSSGGDDNQATQSAPQEQQQETKQVQISKSNIGITPTTAISSNEELLKVTLNEEKNLVLSFLAGKEGQAGIYLGQQNATKVMPNISIKKEGTITIESTIEYITNENSVTITKYKNNNPNNTTAIIPKSIEGITVTSIYKTAFDQSPELENITIPKSIQQIDPPTQEQQPSEPPQQESQDQEQQPPTYTVSFDLDKAQGESPQTQTIQKGGKATEPAPPTRQNYTFEYWYIATDTNKDAFDFDTPITQNITLKAKWTLQGQVAQPSISWASETNNNIKIECATLGASIYYTLDGTEPAVSTSSSCFLYKAQVPIEQTTTIKAIATKQGLINSEITQKECNIYTVSFDTQGRTPATINSQTLHEGQKVATPIEPTRQNYTFDHWYIATDTNKDAYNFDTPITQNITLKAKWQEWRTTSTPISRKQSCNIIYNSNHCNKYRKMCIHFLHWTYKCYNS